MRTFWQIGMIKIHVLLQQNNFLGIQKPTQEMVEKIPYVKQLALATEINLFSKYWSGSPEVFSGIICCFVLLRQGPFQWPKQSFVGCLMLCQALPCTFVCSKQNGESNRTLYFVNFLKHLNGACYIPETNQTRFCLSAIRKDIPFLELVRILLTT